MPLVRTGLPGSTSDYRRALPGLQTGLCVNYALMNVEFPPAVWVIADSEKIGRESWSACHHGKVNFHGITTLFPQTVLVSGCAPVVQRPVSQGILTDAGLRTVTSIWRYSSMPVPLTVSSARTGISGKRHSSLERYHLQSLQEISTEGHHVYVTSEETPLRSYPSPSILQDSLSKRIGGST